MISLNSYLLNDVKNITESSILDIEDTFKYGDEHVKYLNDIENELKIIQKMKWSDWTTTIGEYQYALTCPNFLKYCFGNDSGYADTILFTVNDYPMGPRQFEVDMEMYVYSKKIDNSAAIHLNMRPCSIVYTTEGNARKDIIKSIKQMFNFKRLDRLKEQLYGRVNMEIFEIR